MKTTRKERIQKRAIRKIKHFSGNTYSAYVTPCELLALVDAGIWIERKDYKIELARHDKKNGDSTPRWFYFSLGEVVLPE